MGKFFEALKKSQTSETPALTEAPPQPEKVVNITTERIDALRMETALPRVSAENDSLSRADIDPYLSSLLEPSSSAAESFKVLRARLLVGAPGKSFRTIMVSSPEPLDGKTFVAANLAVTIARGVNEHVMLVDCDLRRPSLGKRFGLKSRSGLRDYLEKGTSLESYLVKTPEKKLTLLPAGQSPPNPSELLSSARMRLLVEELKNRYEDRYIIFDTPPAQFPAETAFLASMVDGVLLVVRYGKTSKNRILEAIGNLGREKIMGVVFNASIESLKNYGYYYKYYHEKGPVNGQ